MNQIIQATVQNELRGLNSPGVPGGLPPTENNPPDEEPTAQNIPGPYTLWKGVILDKKLSMIHINAFTGADEDWQ